MFPLQRYGSDGLKLVNHEETLSFGQAVLKLTFDPGSQDEGLLTAECRLDHPFFVKNKGTKTHVLSFQIDLCCQNLPLKQFAESNLFSFCISVNTFRIKLIYNILFQGGLPFIQALLWCTMGSLAMRCSWVMCACRQTTQMPLTVMTQSSLTLSEGMLFRWSSNFFPVVSHSLGYMISQSSCKYFHMKPGCLEILFVPHTRRRFWLLIG